MLSYTSSKIIFSKHNKKKLRLVIKLINITDLNTLENVKLFG